MTARYRIIEQIYIRKGSAASEQLEQAVVSMYSLILKYLVEAKRYFEQRTGGELIFPSSTVVEKLTTSSATV
jgi:hypothetical protein